MRTILRRTLLGLLGSILRPARTAATPPRILVIKPDHAGDVLLLTPALRLLRARLPDAHITLLVGPWSRDLVVGNPDIDCLQMCAFPGFTRQAKKRPWQPYLLLLQMAAQLRAVGYDIAVIARDDHWWGALLALLGGIPVRVGYAVPEVAACLTTVLPHDPRVHVTVQSLDLVAALSGQAWHGRPLLRFVPGAAAREWAASRMPALPPGQKAVVIHPGAGGQAKLWVADRWATLGRALEQRGYRVILTAGPGEDELARAIAGGLKAPMVVNDAPNLRALGALFAHCALVLGVDSGPLHVAVAAGVATVALFGPGDQARFGPWGDPARHLVFRSGLWCSPCGVLDHCPRGTLPSECMALLPVRRVLAGALSLIEGQGAATLSEATQHAPRR